MSGLLAETRGSAVHIIIIIIIINWEFFTSAFIIIIIIIIIIFVLVKIDRDVSSRNIYSTLTFAKITDKHPLTYFKRFFGAVGRFPPFKSTLISLLCEREI